MEPSIKSSNKIVIAGASGFVGSALIENLSRDFEITGLTRGSGRKSSQCRWIQADLFSLLDCEMALEGHDIAIYLVHSMLPSARLVQGSFEDYDLVLADNFARAAKKCGIKKIIYLGGIIPSDKELSQHLESRLEVENTLADSGIDFLAIRAGLIIGKGGSSFQIMKNLVMRLPIMLCPKWTNTLTCPIALKDIVLIMREAIETGTGIWDVGGADIMTYRNMLSRFATAINLKRYFISVPFFSPGFSRLWVRLITGAPKNLVYPLVESLKSSMVPDKIRRHSLSDPIGFEEMILLSKPKDKFEPTAFKSSSSVSGNEVRSIQRISTPRQSSAREVANYYFNWLPRFLNPFIKVREVGACVYFCVIGIKTPLLTLEFSAERSSENRRLYYIKRSLLATGEGRARLEFRDMMGGYVTIAAIHEFIPRLPWFIYKYTQAIVHLWVMKSFQKAVYKRF